MKINSIGKLIIEEVFIYYNEPLLFTAKNAEGRMFVLNCVTLNVNGNAWVMVEISKKRLEKALKGEFDIRELFTEAESPLWYFVEKEGEESQLSTVEPEDRYLADAGYFLSDFL